MQIIFDGTPEELLDFIRKAENREYNNFVKAVKKEICEDERRRGIADE